jgi:hypothetical protein
MKDSEHPFFRPLWRRITLVVFCAAWCAFEFWNGQAFWGTLAGGMAAYGAWEFLLNYAPKDAAAAAEKPEPEADKE